MKAFVPPGVEAKKAQVARPQAKSQAKQHAISSLELEQYMAAVGQLSRTPGGVPEVAPSPPQVNPLIVDAVPDSHQSPKSVFLARLRSEMQAAIEDDLQGTGWSAEHCPWIEYWFNYYERRDAGHVEAALRHYAPSVAGASNVEEYFGPVIARVREAVARWRATGEVDAPPAEIPAPIATIAELGPGSEMQSSVRSRMESAFGTNLGGTRIHDDAKAARLADQHDAKAFAIGSHIAFAPHAYAPGSDVGDGLLAHELAHTVQQRGATSLEAGAGQSAEQAADRHVIGAFSRLKRGLQGFAAGWAPLRTGLRLSRCGVDTSEAKVTELLRDTPATPGPVPLDNLDPKNAGALPTLPTEGWLPPSDDSLLFVVGSQAGSTKDRLFIVAAAKYVVEAPAPQTISTAPPETLAALPAIGHAGLTIINGGGGSGLAIDVGGSRNAKDSQQAPKAVIKEVGGLMSDLGLTAIKATNLSHLHGDHVSYLGGDPVDNARNMIDALKIDPAEVYVQPGLEDIKTGVVGKFFEAFEKKTGLRPKPLKKPTKVLGPTNETVTRTTLRVGNAVVEMAVGTTELEAYQRAATQGDPKAASALADAATPLQHVRWDNSNVEMVVVGDLRGQTIGNLAAKMGPDAFKAFIGNARIIVGLHHIGAVSESSDVKGLQTLVGAMGGGAEPITVIAQVGENDPLDQELIAGLRTSGIDVLVVRGADGDVRKNIKVKNDGAVEHINGELMAADPKVRAAQLRLEEMEHAKATLERLDDYGGLPGKTKSQVLKELDDAARTLRDLLEQRTKLGTQDTHRKPVGPDAKKPATEKARKAAAAEAARNAKKVAATKASLEANLAEIERAHPIERELGAEQLGKLALPSRQIAELQKEWEVAQTLEEATPRLQQLLASIDPKLAKEIWIEETGAPMYRGEVRDTWGRIEGRLETQRATEEMMKPITFGTGARAASYLGLALQAWDLVSPAVEDWAKARQDQSRDDFYTFFKDAMWWQSKGLHPKLLAETKNGQLTSESADMRKGVARRLFNDEPKPAHRDHAAYAKWEARDEQLGPYPQIDRLVVPSLDTWTQDQRAAFLGNLLRFLTAHINSVEDYYAEFRTGFDPPIRPAADAVPGQDVKWQIHVGVIDGGHVHEAWQDSQQISEMMNKALARSRDATDASIEQWVSHSMGAQPGSPASTIRAPRTGGTGQGSAGEAIVRRLVVTARGAKFYSYVEGKDPIEIRSAKGARTADPDTGVRLLELARTAPSGFVWVAPGDAQTYLRLRDFIGWGYASEIKIPKVQTIRDYHDPDADAVEPSPEKYMSAEEYSAWIHRDDDGFYFDGREEGSYRGTVYIYERRRMIGGIVLMRRSDVGPDRR